MADSGAGVSGPMSTGPSPQDDQQQAVKGMMQLNDLMYNLQPDLSVVVNRTHKTQFPQTQDYLHNQTTVFIVNSGSDFVDPARSFMALDIIVPDFSMSNPYTVNSPTWVALESLNYQNIFRNFYFGPNGSILNLIDSVVVSSRSGDELSRVNDYAQLMNMQLPLIFGQDWMQSIGSNLGMGSYLGSKNEWADTPNEQRTQRFCIPLYLLSPFFNYGRLMPSAIMSGLRIEIRWKPLDQACQMFYTGAPKYLPTLGEYTCVTPTNQPQTEFASFLCPNAAIGTNPPYPICMQPPPFVFDIDSRWSFTVATDAIGFASGMGVLTAKTSVAAGGAMIALGEMKYTEAMVGAGSPLIDTYVLQPGMTIILPFDDVLDRVIAIGAEGEQKEKKRWIGGGMPRFTITDISNPNTLAVTSNCQVTFTDLVCDGVFGQVGNPAAGGYAGIRPGPLIALQKEPAVYEARPGAPIFSGMMTLPADAVVDYTIKRPQLSLCSVQLTDAIQRVLNEVSSVNGLEIVYADWDRTSQPFVSIGDSNPLYMEIRKSASRALSVCARVVETSPNPHLYDSYASCRYSFWNDYQLQLGSLYYPQQRVEDSNADAEIRHDNVLALAYNHFLESGDRYHPKAPPTACSLRGPVDKLRSLEYHPIGQNGEHGTSDYLAPRSTFGKWGSYVNGATTIAATLERSSAFDLSGVPTNNSRTLAVRGNVGFALPDNAQLRANFRAQNVAFLKYVRCARAFLLNIEVEQ